MVKHLILLIILLIALGTTRGHGQENFSDNLTKAIQQGDCNGFEGYFADYLLVHIEDYQKVVSAQQAKTHLCDFFGKNNRTSVKLVKSGDKENQKFYIWNYVSNGQTWRIYVLLTTEKKTPLIHQIDIEKN